MCHSEQSEESLITPKITSTSQNQRCFAPLNMTALFKILSAARDFSSRQPAKRLEILGGTFFDHFLR